MLKFTASVQPGRGRGAKVGFRTLNLRPLQTVEIEDGVYAVQTSIDKTSLPLPAVMHVGTRPTFCDTYSIEVHCFDYTFVNTPSTVEIRIVDKIRQTRTFADEKELAHQIDTDILRAKAILL
jgi:FAD synthase